MCQSQSSQRSRTREAGRLKGRSQAGAHPQPRAGTVIRQQSGRKTLSRTGNCGPGRTLHAGSILSPRKSCSLAVTFPEFSQTHPVTQDDHRYFTSTDLWVRITSANSFTATPRLAFDEITRDTQGKLVHQMGHYICLHQAQGSSP